MNYKFKILFIITISFTICSCFKQQYPESWPPIYKSVHGCPNISGVYFDSSLQSPYSSEGDTRLSILFLQMKNPEKYYLTNPSHIQIVQHELDSFEIIGWRDEVLVKRRTYRRKDGDFKCEVGMYSIGQRVVPFSEQGGYGAYARECLISKSIDRSLVLKVRECGAGFYCIMPVAACGTSWYRFIPKKLPEGIESTD